MSAAFGVPKTTLVRMYKSEKIIRRYCNQLKPILTEHNKLFRLLYAFNKIGGLTEEGWMTYNKETFEVNLPCRR
jgi:hypothetical protein